MFIRANQSRKLRTILVDQSLISRFDASRALEAIDLLRGEHDFRSFAHKPLEEEDTIRHLEINMTQEPQSQNDKNIQHPLTIYNLHFKSRAFLYNQVSA